MAKPGALNAARQQGGAAWEPHSAMLKQCLAAALVRVIPEGFVQFTVYL